MMQQSPLDLTFFGLTPASAPHFRLNLFSTIHEIVFNGKGGYDWNTVYDMPIWLRKFTFNKLKSFYDEKEKAHKKSQQGNNTQIDLNNPTAPAPSNQIHPPSYVTKRSKK